MYQQSESDQQGYDAETISPVDGVVSLDADKYQPAGEQTARSALVVVEGADIRYWASARNGVAVSPSLTDGFLVRDGGRIGLDSFNQIRRFRAMRVSPGLTTLQVEYYR